MAATFTEYRCFAITHDFYGRGEYTVEHNGDEVWFDNCADAMGFIDFLWDEEPHGFDGTEEWLDGDEDAGGYLGVAE